MQRSDEYKHKLMLSTRINTFTTIYADIAM